MYDKLTIYENTENGKDYLIITVELVNIDNQPIVLKNIIKNLKESNRYVKIITTDFSNLETEYFERSVRSNKKGPAFIDRDNRKYYFINGVESKFPEEIINKEREKTLTKIFDNDNE